METDGANLIGGGGEVPTTYTRCFVAYITSDRSNGRAILRENVNINTDDCNRLLNNTRVGSQ